MSTALQKTAKRVGVEPVPCTFKRSTGSTCVCVLLSQGIVLLWCFATAYICFTHTCQIALAEGTVRVRRQAGTIFLAERCIHPTNKTTRSTSCVLHALIKQRKHNKCGQPCINSTCLGFLALKGGAPHTHTSTHFHTTATCSSYVQQQPQRSKQRR